MLRSPPFTSRDPLCPRLLPARDLHVLASLDLCPLTAAQLLKLSSTFEKPFTSERRVRERLQRLRAAGLVRSFPYAGVSPVHCYCLTLNGHRLLKGSDAPLPAKRSFSPIAIGHQHHAYCLAEFVVHTLVAARVASVGFGGYYRENSFRLPVAGSVLQPDCAFQLLPPGGPDLGFVVELDNCTERLTSPRDVDSWERKLRLYDAFQDRCATRFRVLIVMSRSSARLAHILALAAKIQRNPQRSLFYGIALPDYLRRHDPLGQACFLDHRGQAVRLLPQRAPLPTALPPPLVVSLAAC